ncbi:MAG: MMPL family transporter, partial [Desulfatitalea sp.]|nr:MMPL family transporter [Desulfatitalea sp.]
VYLAVGVMATFFLTITVLLCMMSMGRRRPGKDRRAAKQLGAPLSRFLTWVIATNLNHTHKILVVSALIFALAFAGMGKLSVGFNFLEEFKEKVEFRQHTEYIEKVMGGMLSLVYVFDAGKPDGIKNADLLQRLADLQKKADSDPLVKKTYSIVDILKDLNQSFHGDDPAYHTLPADNALISQYLLLYEISGGKELQDYVTGDYARTALEIRMEMTASEKIKRLIRDLDAALDRDTTARVQTTGIGLLWIKICDYIASSQIFGYLMAFSMIAFLMCVVFRSVKVGLLSMVPNLAPIVLCLGLMGWQGLHLDYFRLLLATVAIGIAVDDTIHLVARMRKEFLQCGDYAAALSNSMSSVGRALVITSAILMLAFSAFLSSQMVVLASFGVLLMLTIFTALVADLFLMPALILVFKPFGRPATVKAGPAVLETDLL